jgi:hydrogenase nickel incorporation protein HypA/HybF
MHELSICRSLLAEVERAAAANNAVDVNEIVVAVGRLSGVEPPLLARAFEVARMGTIAEHALLKIETLPVIVWCKACGVETSAAANALLCGQCGTWQVDLKSGTELLLKRVELSADSGSLN